MNFFLIPLLLGFAECYQHQNALKTRCEKYAKAAGWDGWTLDIANKRKHKFLRLSKEEQEKRQRREQTLWAKQITAHKSWYRLTKVNKVIGPKFGLQVKMDWLIQRLLDLEADSTELGV